MRADRADLHAAADYNFGLTSDRAFLVIRAAARDKRIMRQTDAHGEDLSFQALHLKPAKPG